VGGGASLVADTGRLGTLYGGVVTTDGHVERSSNAN